MTKILLVIFAAASLWAGCVNPPPEPAHVRGFDEVNVERVEKKDDIGKVTATYIPDNGTVHVDNMSDIISFTVRGETIEVKPSYSIIFKK